MASVVQQLEGSEASVRVGFEAKRSVPQVVPTALIQEHHLNKTLISLQHHLDKTLISLQHHID